ncbi:MAG: hypothetical protein JWM95_2138 [Gemmatimonadetes bacterium]|nr:hypothetical protein [Gemmatimonadota bacterium]
MRSRAELRIPVEWVLRAALIAALAFALWRSLESDESHAAGRALDASGLTGALSGLLANPSVSSVDLTLDAMPTQVERDALRAMRRAGVTVNWHGVAPALALEADRLRDPEGRTRLLMKGETTPLALADSAGVLDTVNAASGASVDIQSVVGQVRAGHGRFAASVREPESVPLHAVLVLGRADWDSKFVMSALSEAGWTVRAKIPTAPGVAVSDKDLLPLDTSRYDVVIALDTTAGDFAPAIARFVAQGGGLIAGAEALGIQSLRALAPSSAQERRPGRILLAEDSVTPRDLPLRALTALRGDAVALERVPAGITVAARRAGLGRVITVGYDESWRWRMLGGSSGLAAHRRWWSSAVGAVAPERGIAPDPSGDGAPLAALIDVLGPASASSAKASNAPTNPLPIIILLIIPGALLIETASRRFRGVP